MLFPLIYTDIILVIIIIIDCIVTTIKVQSIDIKLQKIRELGELIKEKLKELKETKSDAKDKIRDIENIIEDLKYRQAILRLKIYRQARRLKKAFPTMKSEKITQFLNQKVDFKALREKIRNKVNKRR